MVNTTQSLDLATIERLAEKVTALVQLLEQTRNELSETILEKRNGNEPGSARPGTKRILKTETNF